MLHLLAKVIETGDSGLTAAIWCLHYASPLTIFAYYIFASMMTVCMRKDQVTGSPSTTKYRRNLVLSFVLVVGLSYVFDAIILIVKALVVSDWWPAKHEIVYSMSSILIWGIFELAIIDGQNIVWYPYLGALFIAIAFEIVLVILPNINGHSWDAYSISWLTVSVSRTVVLILLATLFFGLPKTRFRGNTSDDDEERALLLLSNDSGNESDSDQNSTNEMNADIGRDDVGNWWNYFKSFTIFWHFIWPSDMKGLQLAVVVVGLLLLAQRALNLLVPIQLGIITDAFVVQTDEVHIKHLPWFQVLLFVIGSFANSNSGIATLRNHFWIPVCQYAHRVITNVAYDHLSLFSNELGSVRIPGKTFMARTPGQSITLFMAMMLFTFFPILVDLGVAFVYLYELFGSNMALLVGFVSVFYLWISTRLSRFQGTDREQLSRFYQSDGFDLWKHYGNWTAILSFGRISSQVTVNDKQRNATTLVFRKLGRSVMGVAQSLVFTVGLLGACFIAIYQIAHDKRTIGNFVTLLVYWIQLSSSLCFFSQFLRDLEAVMSDANKLNELLRTQIENTDDKGSHNLEPNEGLVVFQNVTTADEGGAKLSGVSFTAKPGSTVVCVGEVNSGTGMLLRSIIGLSEIESGSIFIDGQDIQEVTTSSLRDNMSLVSQDPILFNDTLMCNLKYANLDASDEIVYKACRAVMLHDFIESLPRGYSSTLEECEMVLTNAEMRKISMARTILKDAQIVLVLEDQVTADLATERSMQSALRQCVHGRTAIVLAHRLSTIMNADQILVMKDGEIVEMGTHDQLFAQKGKYYRLWSKQIKHDGPSKDTNFGPLVNDLSPHSKSNELVKRIKDAGTNLDLPQKPQESKSKRSSPGSKNKANDMKESTSPSKHLQTHMKLQAISDKKSKLKPDAAEYVPAAQRMLHQHGPTIGTSSLRPSSPAKPLVNATPSDTTLNYGSQTTVATAGAVTSEEAVQKPKRTRTRRHRTRTKKDKNAVTPANGEPAPQTNGPVLQNVAAKKDTDGRSGKIRGTFLNMMSSKSGKSSQGFDGATSESDLNKSTAAMLSSTEVLPENQAVNKSAIVSDQTPISGTAQKVDSESPDNQEQNRSRSKSPQSRGK